MKTKEEIENLAEQKYPIKKDMYKDLWSENKAFIKGYTQCQEDMIKEIDNLKCQLRDEAKKPKYAVEGDYCAVCGSTEFWNNGDEEE